MSLEKLQQEWNALYREELPRLAKARDKRQQTWTVFLDHCFSRIILDNAVGGDRPWTSVVKSPASRNMSKEQLKAAIDLGYQIARGDKSLQALDERSLALRGKTKGGAGTKRSHASGPSSGETPAETKKAKNTSDSPEATSSGQASNGQSIQARKGEMADVWAAFRKSPAGSEQQANDKEEQAKLDNVRERIANDEGLSDYRKRVLTLLTQVPRGRFTFYKNLADAAQSNTASKGNKSNARAVGSAMRNNPFAPTVPCHRVLAADGKLGGFGGEWGEEGRFANEKRELLRSEGVRFDGKGKVIGSPFISFKS